MHIFLSTYILNNLKTFDYHVIKLLYNAIYVTVDLIFLHIHFYNVCSYIYAVARPIAFTMTPWLLIKSRYYLSGNADNITSKVRVPG